MPASPSRPSTTIARRCDAFCTDRILHGRFCLSTHTENGDLGSPARRSALCLRSSPCGGLLPAGPGGVDGGGERGGPPPALRPPQGPVRPPPGGGELLWRGPVFSPLQRPPPPRPPV